MNILPRDPNVWYPKTAQEFTDCLWTYYAEYIAYDNFNPSDNDKYFNFAHELMLRYRFSPHSDYLRGAKADNGVIQAYQAIKLAKIRKIEKWLLNGMLQGCQINFALFSIKSLGMTDEYIDELMLKRERLQIERDKAQAMTNAISKSQPTTVTIGFGTTEDFE